MQIISFILLAVLALAMLMISIFFVLLISKNMQNGRKFRQNLAQSIKQLRMTKVLKALGLDFDAYLHKLPVQQIRQNMSACKNCKTTSACDEKLNQQTIQQTEIEFCPIQDNFIQFSQLSGKSTA